MLVPPTQVNWHLSKQHPTPLLQQSLRRLRSGAGASSQWEAGSANHVEWRQGTCEQSIATVLRSRHTITRHQEYPLSPSRPFQAQSGQARAQDVTLFGGGAVLKPSEKTPK